MLHQVVLLALLCLPGDGFPAARAKHIAPDSRAAASEQAAHTKRRHSRRRRARAGRAAEGRRNRAPIVATPPARTSDANANTNATVGTKRPKVRRPYDPETQPPEGAPKPTPTRPPAGA